MVLHEDFAELIRSGVPAELNAADQVSKNSRKPGYVNHSS